MFVQCKSMSSGFTKQIKIHPNTLRFMQAIGKGDEYDETSTISRPILLKIIYGYIRDKNLQCPQVKKIFYMDAALRDLYQNGDEVGSFMTTMKCIDYLFDPTGTKQPKKSGAEIPPSLAFCKIKEKIDLYQKINESIYHNLNDILKKKEYLLDDKSIDYDDLERSEIKKVIGRFDDIKYRFLQLSIMTTDVHKDIESCKTSVVCRMLRNRVVGLKVLNQTTLSSDIVRKIVTEYL